MKTEGLTQLAMDFELGIGIQAADTGIRRLEAWRVSYEVDSSDFYRGIPS